MRKPLLVTPPLWRIIIRGWRVCIGDGKADILGGPGGPGRSDE
jgi:hypothetical protein